MFYATKIKQVIGDKAIDERGRILSFIGYLPVTAGDTVFSDGTVIFGNAKVKGYSVVDEEGIAVPVLAAENRFRNSKNELEGGELRGYFNEKGRYKKSPIQKDDWIINDKMTFKHGTAEMDGERIIEVEFSKENDLWIVTDGEYRECQTKTFDNQLYVLHCTKDDDIIEPKYHGVVFPYSTFLYTARYLGTEITLGTSDDTVNNPISIHRGDQVSATVNLRPYAEMTKATALECRTKIMAKSANIEGAVNLIKQFNPPESFVASTWAHTLSFKINKEGDWDAIIATGSYGYCFPYLVFNGSVIDPTFNDMFDGSREFSEKLVRCKQNIERSLFRETTFEFLAVEKYPAFEGEAGEAPDYTAEYRQYILDAMEYYIPLVRFKQCEWYIVAFGASMLYHVHNNEIVTIMQTRHFIGNEVYPYRAWDESQFYYVVEEDGVLYRAPDYSFVDNSTPDVLNEWQFPIDEDFYLLGKGAFITGILDDKANKILSRPKSIGGYWQVTDKAPNPFEDDEYAAVNILEMTETQNHYGVELVQDARAEEIALEVSSISIVNIFNREFYLPRSYYVPVTDTGLAMLGSRYDKFPDERFQAPKLKSYRFVDGFFDPKVRVDLGLDSESRDGLKRYNPCIAKLSSGRYLYGVHNEILQLKRADKWEETGDYLKNFRLREIKNIRKAKE